VLAGAFRGITLDLSLLTQLQLYVGLFERETYPWLRRLSEGIGSAIDVGAADGEYTLYFLKHTKAARVYAFEPDPAPRVVLFRNLELNSKLDLSRVTVSTKRLGSANSETDVMLDSLIDAITYPCLIKMDIDGGEVAGLGGARRLNMRPDVRWLIETHSKVLEDECVRILSSAGFRTQIISPAWWRRVLPEMRSIEQNRWLAAWK